jgi:hypothetical protein
LSPEFTILRHPEERPLGRVSNGAAASQEGQSRKIASDQGFLLFPPPALDLALGGGGVIHSFKILMEHKHDRSSVSRVTIVSARLVLGDACIQAANGGPDIIRAIGATKHIEISAHGFFK